MREDILFTYALTGTGWARAEIKVGEQRAEATASYLSDALPDFLEMLCRIATGAATTASCIWEEEPGEFIWTLDALGGGRARLRLLSHVGDDPDEGRLRLDAACDLCTLIVAVLDGIDALLVEVGGPTGYTDKWAMASYSHDAGHFPGRLCDVLRASVAPSSGLGTALP